MAYRDKVGSGEGLDAVPGFRIKKPQFPHRTYFPDFKSRTIFRAYPQVVNGQIVPFRNSAEEGDWEAAVFPARFALGIGANGRFSYMTHVPGKDFQYQDPTSRFCDAILKQIEENPRGIPPQWDAWKPSSSGGKLHKIKICLCLQGALFEHRGKLFKNQMGQPQPLNPVLFILKSSGRRSFEKMANEPVDPAPQLTGDVNVDLINKFQLGDVFSPAGGRQMYFTGVKPDDGFSYYKLELGPAIQLPEQMILDQWVPWGDLLQEHTEEAQIGMLCQAFTPEAVDFVFGRTELADLLPQAVKGAWAAWEQRLSQQGFAPPTYQPQAAPPHLGHVGQPHPPHPQQYPPQNPFPYNAPQTMPGSQQPPYQPVPQGMPGSQGQPVQQPPVQQPPYQQPPVQQPPPQQGYPAVQPPPQGQPGVQPPQPMVAGQPYHPGFGQGLAVPPAQAPGPQQTPPVQQPPQQGGGGVDWSGSPEGGTSAEAAGPANVAGQPAADFNQPVAQGQPAENAPADPLTDPSQVSAAQAMLDKARLDAAGGHAG